MQVSDVQRIVERGLNRIRHAFRGVVTRVNNAPDLQLVQGTGMAGENLQDNELWQHFGFSSNPPPGTQFVILPIGGKTTQGVMIATENGQYRFKPLKTGEAVVFNAFGDYVVLRDSRVTEINCDTLLVKAATKVRFETPAVETPGTLHADGNITGGANMTAAGDVGDQGGTKTMAGMREAHNTHRHTEQEGVLVSLPNVLA
ncbi:phage baseplate assembly protein V [Ralstonia pseudosolanacearum]|uniref:phage baseplate assembly protein V n=1 Tax=Ralstonia pseudosolanacearum TaxID=1310165 RepID=UPI0008D9E245|nr:phage baseplate assembly protein V [Ralstonia pseudosolanacearum]MCL1618328.1 phage baseplate assembly protein V [Ralstonia pseudosolanacearum CaRs-Mep]